MRKVIDMIDPYMELTGQPESTLNFRFRDSEYTATVEVWFLRKKKVCHYTKKREMVNVAVVDIVDLDDNISGPMKKGPWYSTVAKKARDALLHGRAFSDEATLQFVADFKAGYRMLLNEPLTDQVAITRVLDTFYTEVDALEPLVMKLIADRIRPLLTLGTIDDGCFQAVLDLFFRYCGLSKMDLSDCLEINLSTIYRWVAGKSMPLQFARPKLLRKMVKLLDPAALVP